MHTEPHRGTISRLGSAKLAQSRAFETADSHSLQGVLESNWYHIENLFICTLLRQPWWGGIVLLFNGTTVEFKLNLDFEGWQPQPVSTI